MDGKFLAWRGHDVYVNESGQGDPLLLITGLGGNTHMWAPLMGYFDKRRIIRFDAPGTGRSSTPTGPIPISMLADLAVSVLDDRGVEWADVLGYSYGGAIAQQLAFDHPARVRRLVLAATTCGLGGVQGHLPAMIALSTTLRYRAPSYFDRTAAITYGGRTGRNTAIRRKMMLERHRHPPTEYGYAMQIFGCVGWSSVPFLDQIPHETLVTSGDDDPLIPVANAEYLANRIPNARLEIIERAGHLFLWDDAEHMGYRIKRFIDGPRH
jgi:pimeloyl-ACP methyl ester carboxylesterase